MKIHTTNIFTGIIFIVSLFSCDDFLKEKPDQSLVVPTTLSDLEALLNNDRSIFNTEPTMGFIGSDNYYIYDDELENLNTAREKNAYLWAKDIFEDEFPADWTNPYEQVFYANIVLEGLENISTTNINRQFKDELKGRALFYRSYAYYSLLQLFAPHYNGNNGDALGIPLRYTSDINAKIYRSNLEECYHEIIISLQEASQLIGTNSTFASQPDKEAAYAFLSRIYLTIGSYENAKLYADSCLNIYNKLMDYNNVNTSSSSPFDIYNDEVLFHTNLLIYNIAYSKAKVKPEIVTSFADDDLRKEAYFRSNSDGSYSFKGSYTSNNVYYFGGIATDEIYLIRAECLARLGNTGQAMDDLNQLLKKRWKSGTYIPFVATDQEDAMVAILEERRKELLFRSTRWTDLRRLNDEGIYTVTQVRKVDGKEYKLSPNDLRYVYPIPKREIEVSHLIQNPR